jgi:hypothetical protein
MTKSSDVRQWVEQLAVRWREPARYAARYHRGLAAIVEDDIAMLERLPHIASLPYVIGAFTVLFSLLRLGIQAVYTESIVFLAGALAVGFLSPVAGVLFVLAHAVLDLIRSFSLDLGWPARLMADWLLWLLVVEVPLAARWAEPILERKGNRETALVLVGGVGVMLTVIWALGVPILIRPVFTWAGGVPTDRALDWVQRSWITLSLLAFAASAGGRWVRQTWGAPAAIPVNAPTSRPSQSTRSRVVGLAFLLLAFSGMITSISDVVIIAAAYLLMGRVTALVLRVAPIASLVRRVTRPFRILLAFGVTYVIARIVSAATWSVHLTEFFPVVLGATLGLLVFGVLLDGGIPEDGEPPPVAPTAGESIVRMLIVGTTLVLIPRVAFANNCSSRTDCFHSDAAAAAAAAGAAAAGGLGGGRRRPPQ